MHRRTPARICLTLISTRGAPFPPKEVNESHKKEDPCTYLFLTNGGIVGRTGGGSSWRALWETDVLGQSN